MKTKKVMIYLEDVEYMRLNEAAKEAKMSMSSFVTSLIWRQDLAARKAAEVKEVKCSGCGKSIWVDQWAKKPGSCPFCSDQKTEESGCWGTVVIGKIE